MQTRGESPREAGIYWGQPGAKAKLFRPGVSSGFISHQLPLLSPFLLPESRGDDAHFGDCCIREGKIMHLVGS